MPYGRELAVEEMVDAETVGELQLKGFSRPIPTMNVVSVRGAGSGSPVLSRAGRNEGAR